MSEAIMSNPTNPGELKACPFCGSDGISNAERIGFPVEACCTTCRAQGPSKLTGREADEAWNTRATDSRIAELEARLNLKTVLHETCMKSIRRYGTELTTLRAANKELENVIVRLKCGCVSKDCRVHGSYYPELIEAYKSAIAKEKGDKL